MMLRIMDVGKSNLPKVVWFQKMTEEYQKIFASVKKDQN